MKVQTQVTKLLAASIKHTCSFEKSIIARSLLVRLRELESFDERCGLRGRRQAYPELGAALGEDDLERTPDVNE